MVPGPAPGCPPRAAPGRARASPALPGKFPAPPSLLGIGQAGEGGDPADDRRPPENAAHGGRERYGVCADSRPREERGPERAGAPGGKWMGSLSGFARALGLSSSWEDLQPKRFTALASACSRGEQLQV